ncbi:MAG: flagellar protein FlgN [Fibromonadaceae bacterium]|jgi:predicted transcriptional regulator|nr:flagellar protein FlgN [Fibromonadaceae bacterium]
MSCEREFETLVMVLGKLKDQYSIYEETLAKQREAIVTNNIGDLTEVLSKLESIDEYINRLEGRCNYTVDVIAANKGLTAKTIRDIIKAFPEQDCSKLETVSVELKQLTIRVKKLSASNAELLEISRNIIKETMKTIMTQNVDPRDRAWRTYGNTGGYSRTVRREPVHLVNRQG